MKKSKVKKESRSSCALNECLPDPIEPEFCQCAIQFKELDSFLSNLEFEEHKRVLVQSVKNVKTISDTGGKGLVSSSQGQIISACPFELCSVLHYEGLWMSISDAFLKKGRLTNGGGRKSSPAVKQKIDRNPNPVVKTKKVKTSGSNVVAMKSSAFQHSTPVDIMLQVYRDNNIYSKVHMRRVDKAAIMNAIQCLNYKQTPIPALVPKLEIPQIPCAPVVNISFCRNFKSSNSPNLKDQEVLEHNIPLKLKPRTQSNSLQPFDFKQRFSSSSKNLRR